MATGALWTVTLTNDGTNRILESVRFTPITHDSSLAATTAQVEKLILKKDGTGAKHAWVVKISYPSGSIPATSKTLAQIITDCDTAITAAYGSGELTA